MDNLLCVEYYIEKIKEKIIESPMIKFIVVIVLLILLGIGGVVAFLWWRRRSSEGYQNVYYPVSRLNDEYLAGMPTYSNCPYIRLPHRPAHWHPKLNVYGPGEIEQLRSHKYVYSDNPIYNFF